MTTTKRLASDRTAWGSKAGRLPVVGSLVYDGDEGREVTVVRLPAVDESGFHLARRGSVTTSLGWVGLGLTRTGKLRRGGWVSVESDTGRTGWFKSVDRSFYERRK
jgi:hypothetical protein